MTYDLGASYRAARERIAALVTEHAAVLDRPVPATPEWTVHDVLAHVVGIAVDASNGNMEGAPGDAWTAVQVARGKGHSAHALLADWSEHGPKLENLLSGPQGRMAAAAVMDVHCHEADLRHALGLAGDLPSDFLTWAAESMRARLDEQTRDAGLPPVVIEIDNFEWLRARLGRRTEAEVRGYRWTTDGAPIDPSEYLHLFFIFGRAAGSLGEVARS